MYVYQLAKELIDHGHEIMVLSLSNEKLFAEYKGLNIKYIPFEEYAINDIEHPKNLNALVDIVNEFAPDVFHLHTYTSSMGINHLIKIKELEIKVFFTSHIPNFTCLRGDLMKFGKEVCDGIVTKEKCMNCYLHSTGITNQLVRKLLLSISSFSIIRNSVSRLSQYQAKVDILNTFKDKIDNILVVSQWQKQMFALNGFNLDSIYVCRQSINEENILLGEKKYDSEKVKIGFIGRIVKAKGLHILIESLIDLDQSKYELKIVGLKSINEVDYYNSMLEMSKSISANWTENLESSQIFDFLDDIDLLVIPSIVLETGPIVAFEAMARKVPVLAFNYGGTKELVSEETGFLVENANEMRDVLHEIIENKSILSAKSNSIKFVRITKELYLETINIYTNHI